MLSTPRVSKHKNGPKVKDETNEERKQRNRQAQAAFRQRQVDYIKRLEQKVWHYEETLLSLQQSHQRVTDECAMLRYKNSLLERTLLEKGIEVQAHTMTAEADRQRNLTPNKPPELQVIAASCLIAQPPPLVTSYSRGGQFLVEPRTASIEGQQGYRLAIQNPNDIVHSMDPFNYVAMEQVLHYYLI